MLASFIFSSLIRHHRSGCLRRFNAGAWFGCGPRGPRAVTVAELLGGLPPSVVPFRLPALEDGLDASLDNVDLAETATDLRLLVSMSRSRGAEVWGARWADLGDKVDSSDGVEESFPDSAAARRSGVDVSGLPCSGVSRTALIWGVDANCGVDAGLAVLLYTPEA